MTTNLRQGLAGMVVAVALAACGGGGGDAGNEPGVVLDAPKLVQAAVKQGQRLPSVVLSGHLTGDVQKVAGSIVIVIEDTAGLFETTPSVSTSTMTQYGLDVTLNGKHQASAGRKTGSFRVLVCKDVDCTAQFKGSPLSVPYDIDVTPGFALDRTDVRIDVPFADQPARAPSTHRIGVTLPAALTGWNFSTPYEAAGSRMTVTGSHRVVSPGVGEIELTVGPALMTPGTHTRTFSTYGFIESATGAPEIVEQLFTLTYVVAAAPGVSAVLARPVFEFTHPLAEQHSRSQVFEAPLFNSGVTVRGSQVEYLGHPPAAAAITNRASWLWMAPQSTSTTLCNGAAFPENCLVPGRYEARVVYEIEFQGAISTVYQPITLDVVP